MVCLPHVPVQPYSNPNNQIFVPKINLLGRAVITLQLSFVKEFLLNVCCPCVFFSLGSSKFLQIRTQEILCPLIPCKTFSLIHNQFLSLLLVPISFCPISVPPWAKSAPAPCIIPWRPWEQQLNSLSLQLDFSLKQLDLPRCVSHTPAPSSPRLSSGPAGQGLCYTGHSVQLWSHKRPVTGNNSLFKAFAMFLLVFGWVRAAWTWPERGEMRHIWHGQG